jgi:hypothetical protein
MVKRRMRQRPDARFLVLTAFLLTTLVALAQSRSGVLGADEIKKIVPGAFFFRGQSASVQLRNTVGFKAADKFVLAGLVDTSGYSSAIREKYQGFLITEVKLDIEGSSLPAGQYGFGFKDGKFLVMDVGANDVLDVAAHRDEDLKRAVPLKMVAEGDSYKLYAGKDWVGIKTQ